MTICAPTVTLNTAEMSVVARNLIARKEVNYMTAITALDHLIDVPETRSNRARGLDRVVQRLAVAMLRWSRARAERGSESHQEHSRRVRESNSVLQREADALRLTQRIGL